MTNAEQDSTPISQDDLIALQAPPPMGKPLLFGGLAAFAGAAIWALLVIYAHIELGYLAWGIGGGVGAAMLFAGARGTPLALIAGALALLSIGTGKHMAFRTIVRAELVKLQTKEMTPDTHEGVRTVSEAWAKLGNAPSDEQILDFVKEHDLDVRDVQEFKSDVAPQLQWFLDNKPTQQQWIDHTVDSMMVHASFLDYLKNDFHPADILFAFLGIATAFGMVSKATMAHRMALAQMQIDARRAARGSKDEAEAE